MNNALNSILPPDVSGIFALRQFDLFCKEAFLPSIWIIPWSWIAITEQLQFEFTLQSYQLGRACQR